MLKRLLNFKLILVVCLCLMGSTTFADPTELGNDFYLDKTKVVAQQNELLKNRLLQAQSELATLRRQFDEQSISDDHVNKQNLSLTKLDIAAAKSNLDSINIELSESQQTINLLEKDNHEIENQLNIYNVIGLKISHNGIPNLTALRSQLNYQKKVLILEKIRSTYLLKLQNVADRILRLYNARYARIETLLKSQTMLQLKEKQAKYEIDFQQQQGVWLAHLGSLQNELKHLEHSKTKNNQAMVKLQNEIFYANENINYMYLEMLIVRYQDQIQQLKVSISRSSSITLLNKVSEQTIALSKQFSRLQNLLTARIDSLEKRKSFYEQEKMENATYLAELTDLGNQYKNAMKNLDRLTQDLASFRMTLDQSLQQELSARQGLLGFGVKAWLDLGNEIIIVPTLAFQLIKNLTQEIIKAVSHISLGLWIVFGLLEWSWILLFHLTYRMLGKYVLSIPDHELGHVSLKWLLTKLLQRNFLDIALIGNLLLFFILIGIPPQSYSFLINIILSCLFFKMVFIATRLCLVETVHDRAGVDVRLYDRLKWAFLVGGVITVLTVFLHQLPIIYEVKDLFYRLFLLFLIVVAIFFIKSWDVLPGLILHHIDEQRTYLRRIVRLVGLLIPLLILFNSVMGLFGFLNFVLTVTWYESVFLVVLVCYLILRGLLSELMEYASRLLIRHVSNGWLWTEAFLKPVDKVLRISLFLTAWFILFFFYRWDRQSLVVESLNKLLHYQLIDILNTTITPLNLIELALVGSLLYWAARWTREFVYRFLLSRTKDLGIRNSIAILSQYTMILIGILIGLRILGIDIRALTWIASAFALGVGLGLRDLANNFVCGFLLLLERPLRVGDTVTLGGHEGDVMHIGGRAVTIRTWDHMEVLVPNAEIFSKTFINWTAKDHIVRSVITIKMHRHESPHDVQTLIYQTLADCPNVLSDPPPEVFLKELVDELTEFEIRYYVNLRQIKSRISVRSEVLIAIWDQFEKHGIKPPFPHHEVHLSHSQLPLLPADKSLTLSVDPLTKGEG